MYASFKTEHDLILPTCVLDSGERVFAMGEESAPTSRSPLGPECQRRFLIEEDE